MLHAYISYILHQWFPNLEPWPLSFKEGDVQWTGQAGPGIAPGLQEEGDRFFSRDWGSDGVEREQSKGGSGWALLPLPTPSLSSHLLWAASLPHSQPFSASSPLTQNTLPVWEEQHMQFLNWRRGQGAYSKMEQGGKVWEPLLCRMGNKIAKLQLQLLKQTQIILLSSSESPWQEKYESFHKRLENKEYYILLSSYSSCFISQCQMDLGHMFKD